MPSKSSNSCRLSLVCGGPKANTELLMKDCFICVLTFLYIFKDVHVQRAEFTFYEIDVFIQVEQT